MSSRLSISLSEMVFLTGHNAAVDCWAVGALMCELLTGKSPFQSAAEIPRPTRNGKWVMQRAPDGKMRGESEDANLLLLL